MTPEFCPHKCLSTLLAAFLFFVFCQLSIALARNPGWTQKAEHSTGKLKRTIYFQTDRRLLEHRRHHRRLQEWFLEVNNSCEAPEVQTGAKGLSRYESIIIWHQSEVGVSLYSTSAEYINVGLSQSCL